MVENKGDPNSSSVDADNRLAVVAELLDDCVVVEVVVVVVVLVILVKAAGVTGIGVGVGIEGAALGWP